MRAVVTRVKNASVTIDGKVNGEIGQGFLVLLGVAPTDTEAQAVKRAIWSYWESVPRIRKLCATSWLRRSAICGSLRMKTEK